MSFNIFGPASKDSITVGYISPELGFVDGVSICEANEYAKLNPGAQFIFKTRDFIKYLNINEVNKLTPDDIVSTGSTCSGIKFEEQCGPAKAYFYGGGGIGVQGNPVIGSDGALLAVDLVYGGYGYQYPPLVEVKDNCGFGAGAVTRSVLGEVIETVEYYDQEGDFEEYEICDPTDVGYGRQYDPNGKDIGEWNPNLYTSLSPDPIAREIKEYQNFLQKLNNPWWSTRQKAPLKVTTANKESRTKFNVNFSTWNEFMNTYAISPVSMSNVKGSDFAGIPYAFEWEEDFPYDGEYTFRGLCDNKAELYIDNVKVDDLRKFNDSPNVVKKNIKSGVHRIRLDLLNIPIKEAPPKLNPPKKAPATPETKIICHAGGGAGGKLDGIQDNVGRVIVGKGGNGQPGSSLPGNLDHIGGAAGFKTGTGTKAEGVTLEGKLVGGIEPNSFFISNKGSAAGFGFGGDGLISYRYGLGQNRNGGSTRFVEGTQPATNGGGGAVRIQYAGKTQDYTKPGTYELVVPEGITSLDLTCIGGGGSGYDATGQGTGRVGDAGGGGAGGAYAYNIVDVIPGSKLKIVVGSGGKVPKGRSQNGGDSYVEVVSRLTQTIEPKESTSKSSITTSTVKKNIFNTIDYINKADRQLWRIYPPKGKDSDFFQQYAISPFNELASESNTDSYGGTHVIRWESVEFPVDGNYNIELMVDDNVTLYIGNRAGEGKTGIGNGLASVEEGGDEVVIRKRGFSAPGQSTGKSLETKFFRAGRYRIRAELEQLPGTAMAKGNPIALAINITSTVTSEDIISAKSWKENPMGVALTIEAPLPPIPQEPIVQQEGRCPNNPIWTTRFPNGKEKWWPVKYTGNPEAIQSESWSKFMNRYAISPIAPFSIKGSDGGGIIYRNSWDLDIPYDGFYALRSTVDNAARILIDGQIVAYADYIRGDGRKNISAPLNVFRSMTGFDDSFAGFEADGVTFAQSVPGAFGYMVDYPRAVAQGFTDADIRNYLETEYKGEIGPLMKEKLNDPNWGRSTATLSTQTPGQIFNWRTENPKSHKIFLTKGRHKIEVEVENRRTETYELFDKKIFSTKDWLSPITTTKSQSKTKIICHAGGGFGGKLDGVQDKVGRVIVGKGGDGGRGSALPGNLDHIGGAAGFKTGTGTNAQGVTLEGNLVGGLDRIQGLAKGFGFGGDGLVGALKATNGGDGAVRIQYVGKTQDYTKPGTYEFVVPNEVTSINLVCIGGGGSGYDATGQRTGRGLGLDAGGGGAGGAYSYDIVDVIPGSKLKIVVGSGGKVPKGRSQNGGDSYVEVLSESQTITTGGISVGVVRNEVIYSGPTPIANYKGDFISPLLEDVNASPNEEIQGKTWIFKWTNVDFPEDGQYTLEAEADDNLIVRIDGVEVGKARVFGGRQKTNFNITRGKRTVELELSNIRIGNTDFNTNPVVGFVNITKKVKKATGIGAAWTQNPIGISAMLIPPPCPKLIKGRGVVTEVIVDDPGNGYPAPGGGGYPVSLRLKGVEVSDGGINYRCGEDQIQITPDNGAVLDYVCDTFGRITEVKVLKPGLGFTTYPEITIPSETGINATFVPQFEIVRDPITTPEKLIQVTDLVGLKQTGYVDGRPYYGSVFYKDGIRYAGFYETPGDLVQVYDTLQESITAQVTTAPFAIQRQGTDISSNDPRLNIPNTPENLI